MDEDDEDSSKVIQTYKPVKFSELKYSHREAVEDMKWMPKDITLTRKSKNAGTINHIITCATDGQVMFWDTRNLFKENRHLLEKQQPLEPTVKIQLMRIDGAGKIGLSKLLFRPEQTDTLFYAASDEGEVLYVDWSVRPAGGDQKGRGGGAKKEEV